MSDARAEVLRRVRAALADVPAAERPADVAVPRAYRHADEPDTARLTERLAHFEERAGDYRATVRRVRRDAIGSAVADACRELGLDRLAIPPGLPAAWRPPGIELVEDHGLSAAELDAIDAALTGCAAAIAETGTIVLDGRGACGRRALTLVPDHHVCVVEARQVAETVPAGLARVAAAVADHRAPVTLISGPSASSDIELERVEGVHGPRHLVVLTVLD